MLVDTQYECYSAGGWHATAVAVVAVPALAVLVLALPAALALFLRSNVPRFAETDLERRFGFVYLGLEPRRWWWFFLSTARTSVLAVIGLLLTNPGFQNLVAQAWVLGYLGMLAYFRPYLLRTLHLMDACSVICILTLLDIDMWVLIARVLQVTAYDTPLAVLTLAAPALTLFVLIALTVKVWVADRTGRRSSTVAAAGRRRRGNQTHRRKQQGRRRGTDQRRALPLLATTRRLRVAPTCSSSSRRLGCNNNNIDKSKIKSTQGKTSSCAWTTRALGVETLSAAACARRCFTYASAPSPKGLKPAFRIQLGQRAPAGAPAGQHG
jgi:hypothetical protein